MNTKTIKTVKGFTLIELLVVIGILAVLLSIVLIAINPAKQFAQANNTQRRSDVVAILNAITQYMADNKGLLPAGLPAAGGSATTTAISDAGTGSGFCLNLTPGYLAALPKDPKLSTAKFNSCSDYISGYDVTVPAYTAGTSPRIKISAPNSELEVAIEVTR